ncbi:MAG TPA: FHA domain-containing protein [Candidatus Obscuribacterales bacterium]
MVTENGSCPYCVAENVQPAHSPQNGDDIKAESIEDILSKSNLKTPSGLAILINKDTNERYPLTQSVSKIGRDKANTISLQNDSYVSRHHAWVLFIKGSYWVEDLGSTNGTLLNGEVLSERKQIFPGDRIKLGRTELVFELN